MKCPHCQKPGKYIRTRHFDQGATADVYICLTEGCKGHSLYFHDDKPPTNPVGRPVLPPGKGADSQIQLRVTRARKAAYVRAASTDKQTLAAWSFKHLDAASGYTEPTNEGTK
jgi:hypothetical protein